LAAFAERDEIHDAGGVVGVPFHARSFES
jgi:hypothetical protein